MTDKNDVNVASTGHMQPPLPSSPSVHADSKQNCEQRKDRNPRYAAHGHKTSSTHKKSSKRTYLAKVDPVALGDLGQLLLRARQIQNPRMEICGASEEEEEE